jgi:hypothetical protein
MKPSFNFHIEIDCDLTLEDIWPDGDAPENPTVEDVKRVFYGGEKPSQWVAKRACEDWDLLHDLDVDITKNEPPCTECRMMGAHKLDCSQRRP